MPPKLVHLSGETVQPSSRFSEGLPTPRKARKTESRVRLRPNFGGACMGQEQQGIPIFTGDRALCGEGARPPRSLPFPHLLSTDGEEEM